MNHSTQIEAVTAVVERTLAQLGVPDPTSVVHTFLIRCGFFAGHKFRCGGFSAIWPLGQESIAFYDPDDKLIQTVDLDVASADDTETGPQRRAG